MTDVPKLLKKGRLVSFRLEFPRLSLCTSVPTRPRLYQPIGVSCSPSRRSPQISSSDSRAVGGGVWESNPPEHTLACSQTVLKTATITGRYAPPRAVFLWMIAVGGFSSTIVSSFHKLSGHEGMDRLKYDSRSRSAGCDAIA
jgi:hypothetical protein